MTLDEFADEMRPFFNDICMVHDMELARLVGVAQDEMDRYYIVRTMRPNPSGKHDTFSTAVGHCYSLKGLLPEERYAYSDQVFALNNAGPAETFAIINEREGDVYTPSYKEAA
tara:strand:- start:434 stop:772 length:339 start_codon:yes stop_codon:yes gene_type:complete